MANSKIKQIQVGTSTYDIEPANTAGLTSSDVTTALGYTPLSTSGTAADSNKLGGVNAADYMPYKTAGYQAVGGDGTCLYVRAIRIINSGSYINRPVCFDICGRGMRHSTVTVLFANRSEADPPIDGFYTSDEERYYIYKAAANTWDIYVTMSENWGSVYIERIYGESVGLFNITTPLERVASLPSGGYNASKLFASTTDLKDTQVKLAEDLYTYYPIGNYSDATMQNPQRVGIAGDSIQKVFKNIFVPEDENPTITPPSIGISSIGSTSYEYGTVLTSLSYSLTTNKGDYEFGPDTGVTWSNYAFTGATSSTQNKTTTTGSISLTSFTVGTSSGVTITVTGTHGAGAVPKTKLGADYSAGQIQAGTKQAQKTFNPTATYPGYVTLNSSTTTPTSSLTQKSGIESDNGVSLSYSAGNYLYIYSRTKSTGTIQTNVMGQWADVNLGTTPLGQISITNSQSKSVNYYAYRTTNPFTSSDSGTFRIH